MTTLLEYLNSLIKLETHDGKINVENILKRLGNPDEKDWLEFKASLFPKFKKNENNEIEYIYEGEENEDDYNWNVREAIVALANTIGGMLIIGIDPENRMPVKDSQTVDPNEYIKKSPDKFIQWIEGKISKKETWKTCKKHIKTHIHELKQNKRLTTQCHLGVYDEKPVALIIVYPLLEICYKNELLQASNINQLKEIINKFAQIEKRDGREYFLYRQLGDQGKTERYCEISDDLNKFLILKNKIINICVRLETNDYSREYRQLLVISKYKQVVLEHYKSLKWYYTPIVDEISIGKEVDGGDADSFEYDEDYPSVNNYYQHEKQHAGKKSKQIVWKKRGPIFDLVNDSNAPISAYIVRGAPGTGKTTLLKKLQNEWANDNKCSIPVSIIIPGKKYNSKQNNLFKMISTISGLEEEDVKSLVEERKIRILIDDFNEGADTKGLVADILRNGLVFKNLILTCRTTNEIKELELPTFQFASMSQKQKVDFISQGLNNINVETILAEKLGGKISEILAKHEYILTTPYLLNILVEQIQDTYNNSQNFNSESLSVINLINIYFVKWILREINGYDFKDYKKRLISEESGRIKQDVYNKICGYLSLIAFEQQLNTINANCFENDPDIREFQEFLLKSSCNIVSAELIENQFTIQFQDAVFAEYFAGYHLAHHPDDWNKIPNDQARTFSAVAAYALLMIDMDQINQDRITQIKEKIASINPWLLKKIVKVDDKDEHKYSKREDGSQHQWLESWLYGTSHSSTFPQSINKESEWDSGFADILRFDVELFQAWKYFCYSAFERAAPEDKLYLFRSVSQSNAGRLAFDDIERNTFEIQRAFSSCLVSCLQLKQAKSLTLLYKRGLLGEECRTWIHNAKSRFSMEVLLELNIAGLIPPETIRARLDAAGLDSELIKLNDKKIADYITYGILKPVDIPDRFENVVRAGISQLAFWVRNGIVSENDLKRFGRWLCWARGKGKTIPADSVYAPLIEMGIFKHEMFEPISYRRLPNDRLYLALLKLVDYQIGIDALIDFKEIDPRSRNLVRYAHKNGFIKETVLKGLTEFYFENHSAEEFLQFKAKVCERLDKYGLKYDEIEPELPIRSKTIEFHFSDENINHPINGEALREQAISLLAEKYRDGIKMVIDKVKYSKEGWFFFAWAPIFHPNTSVFGHSSVFENSSSFGTPPRVREGDCLIFTVAVDKKIEQRVWNGRYSFQITGCKGTWNINDEKENSCNQIIEN